MGFLSVSTALAVAAAAPAGEAPALPVIAAISVVKLAAASDPVIVDETPRLDPVLTRARLRQPLVAFQAPVQFIAFIQPVHFASAAAGKTRDIALPSTRQSTYLPRVLLMGSEYMGSRPHERGIGRWGSKVVLRMTADGASLGVNGGVAGALMRLAALND